MDVQSLMSGVYKAVRIRNGGSHETYFQNLS